MHYSFKSVIYQIAEHLLCAALIWSVTVNAVCKHVCLFALATGSGEVGKCTGALAVQVETVMH